MENVIFGLAGLTSYYPFYLLNKEKEGAKKIDKTSYNLHPFQYPNPGGTRIRLHDGSVVPIRPTPDDTTPATCDNGQMVDGVCQCDEGYTMTDDICVEDSAPPTPTDPTCGGHGHIVNNACLCDLNYVLSGSTCVSSNDPTSNYPLDPLYNLSNTLSNIITTLSGFTNTLPTMSASNIVLDAAAATDKLTILGTATATIAASSTSPLKAICRTKLNTIRTGFNTEMNQITTLMNTLLASSDLTAGTTIPSDNFYTSSYDLIYAKVMTYYKLGISDVAARASILNNYSLDSAIGQNAAANATAYAAMIAKFNALDTALNARYTAYLGTITTFLSGTSNLVPLFSVASVIPSCDASGKIIISDFTAPGNAETLLNGYSAATKGFATSGNKLNIYSNNTVKTTAAGLYTQIGDATESTTFLGKYTLARANATVIATHKSNIITAVGHTTWDINSAAVSSINVSTFNATDVTNINNAYAEIARYAPATCKFITSIGNSDFSDLQDKLNQLQSTFFDQMNNSYNAIIGVTFDTDYLPTSIDMLAKLTTLNNSKIVNDIYNVASYIAMMKSSFIHKRTGLAVNSQAKQTDLSNVFTNSIFLNNINKYYINWLKKFYICKSASLGAISTQTLGDIYFATYAYETDLNLLKPPTVDQTNRIANIKKIMIQFYDCIGTGIVSCNVSGLAGGESATVTRLLIGTSVYTLSNKIKNFITTNIGNLDTEITNQPTTMSGHKTIIEGYYNALIGANPVPLTAAQIANVTAATTYVNLFKKSGSGTEKRIVDSGQNVVNFDYLLAKLVTKTSPSDNYATLMQLHYNLVESKIAAIINPLIPLYLNLRSATVYPLNVLTAAQDATLTTAKSQLDDAGFIAVIATCPQAIKDKFNMSSSITSYTAGQTFTIAAGRFTSGGTPTTTFSANDLYRLTYQLNDFNKKYNETIVFKSSTTYPEGNLIFYNTTLYPLSTLYPSTIPNSSCLCNHPSCTACTIGSSNPICTDSNKCTELSVSCPKTKVTVCRLSGTRWSSYYTVLQGYYDILKGITNYADNSVFMKTTDNSAQHTSLISLFESTYLTLTRTATVSAGVTRSVLELPGLLTFFKQVPPMSTAYAGLVAAESGYLGRLKTANNVSGNNNTPENLAALDNRNRRVGFIISSQIAYSATVQPFVGNKENFAFNPYESDNDYTIYNTSYIYSPMDRIRTKFDTFVDYDEDISYIDYHSMESKHYIKENMLCAGTDYQCPDIDSLSFNLTTIAADAATSMRPYSTEDYERLNDEISILKPIYENLLKGIVMTSNDAGHLATIKSDNVSNPIDTSLFEYSSEWTLYNYRNELIDNITDHKVITNAKKIRIQRWIGDDAISLLHIRIYRNDTLTTAVIPDGDIQISTSLTGMADNSAPLTNLKNQANSTAVITKEEKGAYFEFTLDTASGKTYNKKITKIEIVVAGSTQADYDKNIGCSVYVIDPDDYVISDFPIRIGQQSYSIDLFDNRSNLLVKFDDYFGTQGTNNCGKIRHILITRPTGSNDIRIKKIIIRDTANVVIIPNFILAYPVKDTNSFGYYASTLSSDASKIAVAAASTQAEPNCYFHIDLGSDKEIAQIEIQRPSSGTTYMNGLRIQGISSFYTLIYEYDNNDVTDTNSSYIFVVSNNITPRRLIPYLVDFAYPACKSTFTCSQLNNGSYQTYSGYKYNLGNNVCFIPSSSCNAAECLNTRDLASTGSCNVDFDTRILKFRYIIVHKDYDHADPTLTIRWIKFYDSTGTDITNNLPIKSYSYPARNGAYANLTHKPVPNNDMQYTDVYINSALLYDQYFFYDLGSDVGISKIEVNMPYIAGYANHANYTFVRLIKNDNTVLCDTPIADYFNSANELVTFYPIIETTIATRFNKDLIRWKTNSSDPTMKTFKLSFKYPNCLTAESAGNNSITKPMCRNSDGTPIANVNYTVIDSLNSSVCYTIKNTCPSGVNCMESLVSKGIPHTSLSICEESYPYCMFVRVQKEASDAGALAITYLGVSYVDDISSFYNFDYYHVEPIDTRVNPQSSRGDLYSGSPSIDAVTAKITSPVALPQYVQGMFGYEDRQIYAVKVTFGGGASINNINLYVVNKAFTCLYKRTFNDSDIVGGSRTVISYAKINTRFYFDPTFTIDALSLSSTDSVGVRTYALNMSSCIGNCTTPTGNLLPGGKYMFKNNDACFTPNRVTNVNSFDINGALSANAVNFDSCSTKYRDTTTAPEMLSDCSTKWGTCRGSLSTLQNTCPANSSHTNTGRQVTGRTDCWCNNLYYPDPRGGCVRCPANSSHSSANGAQAVAGEGAAYCFCNPFWYYNDGAGGCRLCPDGTRSDGNGPNIVTRNATDSSNCKCMSGYSWKFCPSRGYYACQTRVSGTGTSLNPWKWAHDGMGSDRCFTEGVNYPP